MNTPLGYFSVDQTGELTELRPELIRRWANEGIVEPSYFSGNRNQPLNRLYRFDDVVILRALAEARKYGVAGRELRRIAQFVEAHRGENGTDQTSLHIVGKKAYFTSKDAHDALHLLTVSSMDQTAELKIRTIDLAEIRRGAAERIVQWQERQPQQLGQTESNRFVMSGEEVFAGTRIPVDVIANLVEIGWDDDEILANYPRLSRSDLDVARQRRPSSMHAHVH